MEIIWLIVLALRADGSVDTALQPHETLEACFATAAQVAHEAAENGRTLGVDIAIDCYAPAETLE